MLLKLSSHSFGSCQGRTCWFPALCSLISEVGGGISILSSVSRWGRGSVSVVFSL